MPYFYLILSVFMSASSGVFGKIFNQKNEGCRESSTFYNFLLMLSVSAGWGALYAFDTSFDARVLPYSLLFAACYTICNIGFINALRLGPAMLTSLFTGLSMLLIIVWGFIFWDTPLTLFVAMGLVLVACAIFLCLYTKGGEKKTVSAKWLGCVMVVFFGNAGCSIVQRSQQMRFEGQHGKMLMFFACLFSAVAYLVIFLRSDKRDMKRMRRHWVTPVCAGLCNVALNLFVILLASTALSPSLIYPVISVGALAVMTVFSLFAFQEKMRWWQWLGVGVGAVAVALLSI